MASPIPTPARSAVGQVNITHRIDDAQGYQTIRELCWPDGLAGTSCQSTQVIHAALMTTKPARQRYECTACPPRLDALTDTLFAGHHQPLKVWGWGLSFMGL